MNTPSEPNLEIDDPLRILSHYGGYYECPKDNSGKRLGPLVGYAGKYDGKQYVGDVYVNYAIAEHFPFINKAFANRLRQKLTEVTLWYDCNCICGAPMGGLALAQALASYHQEARYIYPEKEIKALATATAREQSKMVFKRHTVPKDARVIIVEDVLNNFSTTDDLVGEIVDAGATVIAIVGFLNRSIKIKEEYHSVHLVHDIPVIPLVSKPFDQFKQEDQEVANDIASGNVVWKPKHGWSRLQEAMTRHQASVQ